MLSRRIIPLYPVKEQIWCYGSRALRNSSTDSATKVNLDPLKLSKELRSRIKLTGPITIAEYMREALTHPTLGYYMTRDVFGEKGDFVTSPEVTQMFGEMVAIWFIHELDKIHFFQEAQDLQIIELGPGRATLSSDILRVFSRLRSKTNLSLHLVEVSPFLCKVQEKTLKVAMQEIESNAPYYACGLTPEGLSVYWYRKLQDVPQCSSIIVGHEFLDALPIHKFKKTEAGYREVLVDISATDSQFQYALSRKATPTSMFLNQHETRPEVEICPEALVLMEHIGSRFEKQGGIALLADYGHNGDKTDTFRAFKKHKQQDPLHEPGTADLTADVDFSQLRVVAEKRNKLITYGPVTQGDFLKSLGIEVRLQMLLKKANESEREYLINAYNFMVNTEHMGERYKFFSLFPYSQKSFFKTNPVIGF